MNGYTISNESISSIGRDPRNTFYSRGQAGRRAAMTSIPGEKINRAEMAYEGLDAAEPEYNIVDKFLYLTSLLCILIVCALVFIL